MPMLKDTMIFKLLDNRGSENAKIYAGILLECTDDIGKFLEYIKTTFPDFPDHGIQHALRILDYVARVLGERLRTLSDTEIFCFILSALFHDTGMSLVGFAAKNTLRVNHPENAARVIDAYFNEALPRLKGRDRIKSVVKYVCKAHGLDINAMYQDKEFFAIDTINGDDVRNSVLSVFLRIGDLLDLDEQRTSWLAMKLFHALFSEEAKAHNVRHLNVLKYHYGTKGLNVEVKAQNITEYKIWNEWFGYLDNEILYANTYLKNEDVFFPALTKSIKKDDNADFEVEEIRFELDDKGGMWEIISQSIYTNEFDFIREVIQNAIDATLIDTYLNVQIPIEHPSPRSWTLSPRATPVYVCYSAKKNLLYVIDNGIGMSTSDLRRFLFKVSSTGYRDTNKRSFPFPSIAKYGIGFVSCLINAERIEIYTTKQTDDHMQKVTLETGLNQAFIERIPADSYIGTTLVIKLKHPYTFEKIHDYIRETFLYPSVEITCVDMDNLAVNVAKLDACNIYHGSTCKPYKLPGIADEIRQIKNRTTTPMHDKQKDLIEVEAEADELIDWIRENSAYDKKHTDSKKFADFRIKVRALEERIRYADIKAIFPFALSEISERELFTSPEEYIGRLNAFIGTLEKRIAEQSELLKEYPSFHNEIAINDLSFYGDWNFIVAELDNNLRIYNIEKYRTPIDLSHRTGIILMRHTYKNYDDGIEYAAINGFLFNNGAVTNRLIQVNGYHEVLHSDVRKKSFILGTYDSYGSIREALQSECFDALEDNEEEVYLINTGDGEYVPGMTFEPVGNIVTIIDNKFLAIRDIDLEREVDIEKVNQTNQDNIAESFQPVDHKGYVEARDDFRLIDSMKSAYCQDGIVIPFEIEQLFPIGYMRLLCNTTCTARMPLNVTRHETSRIRSDIDAWYDNVGSKIQTQIYQNVCKMLRDVNLDLDSFTLSQMIGERSSQEGFGLKSLRNLRKLAED